MNLNRKFERLTKTRVQHEQSHLVAFLSTGDSDKTLVAVILRLVDLDNTTAELSDFVDLCSTLANNCANHIVGDENLLCQRLSRYHTLDRLLWRASVAGSRLSSVGGVRTIRVGCVRSSAGVCLARRASTIMDGCLSVLLRCLSVRLLHRVTWLRRALGWVRATELLRRAPLTTSRLRDVGYNLHTAGNDTGRSTTTGGISRSSWSTEAFGKLLYQSTSNIVGGNVDSISHTQDDKRSLGGQRKARIRCVQSSTRGFLDLTDSHTTLTDDGANEDVRNQQAQRVGLGLRSRG